MPERVTGSPAALELLERLRAEHGDLIMHLSGAALAGVPIVIDIDQDRRRRRPAFHIGVAPGEAGGFSLEALERMHFTIAGS